MVRRVAAVLAGTGDAVIRTSDGMAQIAASAQEQNSASGDIARRFEQITRLATDNSTAVAGVASEALALSQLAGELNLSPSNLGI